MDVLKGKWLKHPLHPILVHIPVAVWPSALVFDLLSQMQVGGNAMVRLSFYSILFGLGGALLAIPTGVMDWSEIKKEKPAWKIGLYHMTANLVVSLVYAINLGVRLATYQDAVTVPKTPLLLSVAGTILLLVSAYLGGLMVYDHGVSIARMSKEKWRTKAESAGANLPPKKQEKGEE